MTEKAGGRSSQKARKSPGVAPKGPAALSARAKSLIRKLALQPHPEGGFYREIHRSDESVSTARGRRSAVTTIYFLLPKGACSLFHKVASDEIWHHYEGAPLRLIRLDPDLGGKEEIRLRHLAGKTVPVAVIPRGHWQAAESLGDYTLVGCTVGPGFDFADFRMVDGASGKTIRARFKGLARFTIL